MASFAKPPVAERTSGVKKACSTSLTLCSYAHEEALVHFQGPLSVGESQGWLSQSLMVVKPITGLARW